VTSGVALSAASGNPFDQVLAKLDAIAAMLTPTPPAPTGPVTLASAPMYIGIATDVFCLVANFGTEDVLVNPEIFDIRGAKIGGFPFTIPAGESEGVIATFDGGTITARCELTLNQPATVRASIQLFGPGFVAIGDMR
jgi:hypothetical protein